MNLTPIEERALALLVARGQPVSCSNLGDELWGGGHAKGTAPFARSAGKVLRSLERKGLARLSFRDPLKWEPAERGK